MIMILLDHSVKASKNDMLENLMKMQQCYS